MNTEPQNEGTSDTTRLLRPSSSFPSRGDQFRASASDPRLQRLPFTYHQYEHEPPSTSSGSGIVRTDSAADIDRAHNMSIRYRFFNRLDRGTGSLTMPDHVVPQTFFSVLPFDDFKGESGKQNSFVTIFSIWNTMMGTSLLAMPWAMQQAGFAFGTFLIFSVGLLSLYTAYRVVQSPTGLTLAVDSAAADLPDVCRYFWGSYGTAAATFFSVIVLLGSCIVYWVIMSNFLFYTGSVIYDAMQPNSTIVPILVNRTFMCDVYCPYEQSLTEDLTTVKTYFTNFANEITNSYTLNFDSLWTLQGTVPIYLAFLVLPLLNFKSPTFFTKFNVLGTVSVMYLLIFVGTKALQCGVNIDFSDVTSEHFARLFNWNFPALTGTLALSYFIHNAVLTILRNQANPANNARDLTLGYCLAAFCYLFVANVFFISFPTRRSCIADNLLNNFGSGDVMSVIARLFILFQMLTVLPLLMYLIRVQFFFAILGKIYPGFGYVLLLNLLILFLAVFIAIVYPHIGSILRFVGSFSGLVYVFTIPCAVHLKRLQMQGRLTKVNLVVHGTIIFFGIANFLSQFLLL